MGHLHSRCQREAVLHYVEIIIRQFSSNGYLTGFILLFTLTDFTAIDFKLKIIDQDNLKLLEIIGSISFSA